MGKKYFKMAADPAICNIGEMDQPVEVPLLFRDGPWVDDEEKHDAW
jgi:hypothetical protein